MPVFISEEFFFDTYLNTDPMLWTRHFLPPPLRLAGASYSHEFHGSEHGSRYRLRLSVYPDPFKDAESRAYKVSVSTETADTVLAMTLFTWSGEVIIDGDPFQGEDAVWTSEGGEKFKAFIAKARDIVWKSHPDIQGPRTVS